MIARSRPPAPDAGAAPPGAALDDDGSAREVEGAKVRSVRSADLLGEAGLLHIDHDGEIYSLRRTRNGRLILTK
jgi:hemin uptake protein HemP